MVCSVALNHFGPELQEWCKSILILVIPEGKIFVSDINTAWANYGVPFLIV